MSTYAGDQKLVRLAEIRSALIGVQGNLSLAQLVALATIAIEPGLSVNELADRLKIPQQTASRHVAVLTGRYQSDLADAPLEALIIQQINENDPRKRALYLTLEGLEFIAALTGSTSREN
jgi:DNA-binding MarR family transcriptional regulator